MLKSMLRGLLAGRGAAAPSSLDRAVGLLDEGRLEEAEAVIRQLCVAQPDESEPRHLLGHVLSRRGQLPAAIAVLEQASEIAPDSAAVHYSLGRARFAFRAFHDAATALRRAAEIEPSWAPAWLSVGDAEAALDSVDEAEDSYLRALELAPNLPEAYYNYANLLLRLGRIDEAVKRYEKALELKPDFQGAHTNLVYTLNFVDPYSPEDVFRAHLAWAQRYAEPLTVRAEPHARRRGSQRPLRVGYVSANFRDHAVTYFFEPVLRHHDARAFRIYCYSDVKAPDARTKRLRRYPSTWRDIAGQSDEEVARLVRADRIDILVDLTGLTQNDRLLLFARRPAPVQVTWNGYANTTGMSAMDYRITDAYADPPGMTEHVHTERLLRMPEIYMPFEVPDDDVPAGLPPMLERGYVTFGSFNALSKLSARTIRLWSRILEVVPSARLTMLTVPDGRTRTRLHDAFARYGIEPGRLELRGRLSHREFMTAHTEADIALDSFPFHGTTTTSHTLWMGVPLVTLAGPAHASRVGVSMLSNAGLAHLVASTEDEYVSLAVTLAQDPSQLQELRAQLRERMRNSPNMNGPRFTRALEDTYTKIWNDYCRNQKG